MIQVVPNLNKMPSHKIHSLKRWVQRNYIHFHRKFFDIGRMDSKQYDHEEEALQICKKLIKAEDSILLIASGKRFVKNERMGIYIIIEGRNVNVINHIYSYSVYLGEKAWSKLIDFYDDRIEQKRIEFETEITSNIKHSLKNIITEIDGKF